MEVAFTVGLHHGENPMFWISVAPDLPCFGFLFLRVRFKPSNTGNYPLISKSMYLSDIFHLNKKKSLVPKTGILCTIIRLKPHSGLISKEEYLAQKYIWTLCLVDGLFTFLFLIHNF